MTDQLQLTLEPTPVKPDCSQLRVLPGTEFEHIFGMPAPGDAADEPLSRSNTREGDPC